MKKKNINSTDKKYEYDYGNKLKYFYSHFWGAFTNISTALAFSAILWAIGAFLTANKFGGKMLPEILRAIVSSITIFGTVVLFTIAIITIPVPKYVLLKNTAIKVRKTYMHPNYFFRGQFETIPYYSIKICRHYVGLKSKSGSRDYATLLFNWDSLVEIITIDNKRYYIPVKDVDDFIAEVNERRKRFQINSDNSTGNKA